MGLLLSTANTAEWKTEIKQMEKTEIFRIVDRKIAFHIGIIIPSFPYARLSVRFFHFFSLEIIAKVKYVYNRYGSERRASSGRTTMAGVRATSSENRYTRALVYNTILYRTKCWSPGSSHEYTMLVFIYKWLKKQTLLKKKRIFFFTQVQTR